tara:strand:- start:216 stop:1556 length:1341 start_codon:yes stop_codon:yes gene_type:complete
MSIQKRRNSLLKSSISIDSIRKSVVKFREGIVKSNSTASDIIKTTNRNNIFSRKSISKDNEFFNRRREAVRRRQREDELEASSVSGVTKRQGNIVSRSTKGFLGRILDFLGIVLIGWFINTLPKIIEKIKGFINLIRKVVGVLTGFVEGIGDFLTTFGMGIQNAIDKIPFTDLLAIKKENEENLDSTEGNLIKTSNDLTDTANEYNYPENVGLKSFDEGIIDDFDTEGGTREPKDPKTSPPSGGAESKTQKDVLPQETLVPTLSSKTSENVQDKSMVESLKNDKDIKDLQSSNARSKGDTIEKKNNEIESENESKEGDKSLVSGFNNIMSDLFGSKGKQESDNLKEQTDEKKANSISAPKINVPDENQEGSDKIPPLIVPMKRGRKNLRKTKGSGTTIMVIEKPVESSSNMSGPAMSGGKTKTLNLDVMKKGSKNIMKKLHKIILQ